MLIKVKIQNVGNTHQVRQNLWKEKCFQFGSLHHNSERENKASYGGEGYLKQMCRQVFPPRVVDAWNILAVMMVEADK